MIDLILGPLGALLAGIVAVVAAWAKGRADGRQAARRDALEGYKETREAIDDAAKDLPDDPDDLRRWLRERGRKP